MNLPIHNEQLCEAKDIRVVIGKDSAILHLVLSFGPIILSRPLCIAVGNKYSAEGMLKNYNRKASHCQKQTMAK